MDLLNSLSRSFIFPLFVLTSAVLVIVAWWFPNLLSWFASPWMGGLGVVAILATLWARWKGRLSQRLGYDLFLWGTLWCWLAYWFPLYGPEGLVFRTYPIFFLVLDITMSNIISAHKEKMTVEEHRLLAQLAVQWWFNSKLLAAVVLVALSIPGHYLVYPAVVGMLMLRMALEQALAPK